MENNKSIWELENKNSRKYRCLEKNIETDVCVIGGGITGISTAYYLSKNNFKVTVLEKDEICSKTSGKTTGKLTSQHHLFYDYLINSEDKDFAKKYLKANEEAIDNIEKIINNENIKCDFERKNAYVFTKDFGKVQMINSEVNAMKTIDRNVKFVNNIEILGKVEGAIEFKNQAQFNPVKYVTGLADICIKNGVEIFENSKVIEYSKDDDKFCVVCENGNKVFSKYLVVCTRYPIFNVPGFHFVKMYQELEYGIAIKTDTELNGMYVSLEVPTISFRSYNNGNDKYILIVGNGHKTGEKQDENNFEYLENFVNEYFQNSEIITRWTAEDCIGLDKIAYIGEYSEFTKNMYVATGFKKWGMTTSNIAANIICDKICGKKNKYENIFNSTRVEPIKNREEMGNMLKEATESIIMPRLKMEKGKKYCKHLGCELTWNDTTKTWDCPCHGSRYEKEGELIEGPSVKDLD